jgi:hypothetical protein
MPHACPCGNPITQRADHLAGLLADARPYILPSVAIKADRTVSFTVELAARIDASLAELEVNPRPTLAQLRASSPHGGTP